MVLPEPFTAVATSLGLLSTLFGLLVTSLRTIHEIGEDFHLCQLELNLLNNRVNDVLRKIEHIDRTWVAGIMFGEDLYAKLFGNEAATEVAERAKLVEAFSQVVLKVIRKGYDIETWRDHVGPLPQNTYEVLRPEDSLAWKEWAEQVFRGFAQRVHVKHVLASRAVERMVFAMLRRADLSKKVKSLEEAMQSFETCLQNHFRGLPSICGKPSEPDREYFNSIVRLAGSHQELTDCLLHEYHATLDSSRQCGVYLSEAERRTVYQDLLARAHIHFELCISLPGAPDRPRDGNLARVQWPDLDDASRNMYAEPAEFVASVASTIQLDSHALSEIYKALQRWDPEDVEVFRKYSEDERYCTMMRLFISTSLLWSTPWVDQLGIFNLQRHQTLDAEARISMWTHPRDEVPLGHNGPSWAAIGSHHSGSREEDENPHFLPLHRLNRFTRLGLVICDIALCFPIIVNTRFEGLRFSYPVRDVMRSHVSARELVQDVEDIMPGLRGAEVLSALCVPTHARPATARYVDVCATLDADQKRLERFYEDFHKQRETQKTRNWLGSFGAKHDDMLLSVEKLHPNSPDLRDRVFRDTLPYELDQNGEMSDRQTFVGHTVSNRQTEQILGHSA